MRPLFFSACVFVAAALASAPALAVEARFACEDGSHFTASFTGGQQAPGSVALAFADGAAVTLPQVPSADGGRYAGGGMQLWVKGRGATLTRGAAETDCRAGS